MSDSLQELSFDVSEYERPSEKWTCGWAPEGASCGSSPTPEGRCWVLEASEDPRPMYCQPRRVGGTYVCSLPRHRGGPCTEGPDALRACSHPIPPCQPVLTMRARRGRVVWLTVAATLGLIVAVALSEWRDEFVEPGELTRGHRRMDTAAGSDNGCSNCHVQRQSSWSAWLTHGLASTATAHCSGNPDESCSTDADCQFICQGGTAAARRCDPVDLSSDCVKGGGICTQRLCRPTTTSDLCLGCHDLGSHADVYNPHSADRETLDTLSSAKAARNEEREHGVSIVLAAARRLNAGSFTENRPLSCTLCHVEHQGRQHDLTKMSDAQCQVCHVTAFSSFADGHPCEFPSYSFARKTDTMFDHRSHATYFSQQEPKEPFTCRSCHPQDSRGVHMASQGFAASCRRCHSIKRFWGDPVEIIVLPSGEPSVDKLAAWLDTIAEDDPEHMTPLAKLLLVGVDDETEASLEVALSDWEADEGDWKSVLPAAVSKLLKDLALPGKLKTRLKRSIRRLGAFDEDLLDQLADDLEDLLHGELPYRVLPMRNGEIVVGPWTTTVIAPDGTPISTKLSYHPMEHPDRFAQAWLELTAPHADSKNSNFLSENIRAMFNTFGSVSSPGRCLKCHPRNGGAITWAASPAPDPKYRWTSFAHGPHVSVVDCKHCHTWNQCYDNKKAFHEMYVSASATASEGSAKEESDECQGMYWNFAPVRKDKCVACHDRDSALGSCLECHSYHVPKRSMRTRLFRSPAVSFYSNELEGYPD